MRSVSKIISLCSLTVLALIAPRVEANSLLNVPSSQVTYYADGGVDAFFDVGFTGVPSGFDIENDIYAGWCVSYYAPVSPTGQFHSALLYSTTGRLPATLQASYWGYVNYILNHKLGGRDDIQEAIWYFTDNFLDNSVSAATQALIADALAHGQNFVPGPNDITAVLVITTDARGVQKMVVEGKPKHEPPPNACDDFVTGGGFIITSSGSKANFGVHGGIRNGALWGGLNYIDHGTGMHVKSTAVTSYTVLDANTRQIGYNVTIDGQAGTAIVQVTDNGEPGTHDIFKIRLSNGYVAGGELGSSDKQGGGGNIQLHKCKGNGRR